MIFRKIPGAKIMALTSDGRELVLKHKFQHRDDPALFRALDRMREAGSINETLWRPAIKGEV